MDRAQSTAQRLLPQVRIDQAREIATQIMGHVRTIQQMALASVDAARDDEAAAPAQAAQVLAAQVGWLAELLHAKLGGAPVIGDAETWMLAPAYHQLTEGRCHG